jgi:hypothetical protein
MECVTRLSEQTLFSRWPLYTCTCPVQCTCTNTVLVHFLWTSKSYVFSKLFNYSNYMSERFQTLWGCVVWISLLYTSIPNYLWGKLSAAFQGKLQSSKFHCQFQCQIQNCHIWLHVVETCATSLACSILYTTEPEMYLVYIGTWLLFTDITSLLINVVIMWLLWRMKSLYICVV